MVAMKSLPVGCPFDVVIFARIGNNRTTTAKLPCSLINNSPFLFTTQAVNRIEIAIAKKALFVVLIMVFTSLLIFCVIFYVFKKQRSFLFSVLTTHK
jgi:hypothetical protein